MQEGTLRYELHTLQGLSFVSRAKETKRKKSRAICSKEEQDQESGERAKNAYRNNGEQKEHTTVHLLPMSQFSLFLSRATWAEGGEAWTNFSPASTSRIALSLPTLPRIPMHRHICVLSEKRPPAHSEPPAAGPGRNGFGFPPSPFFPQEARISPARR